MVSSFQRIGLFYFSEVMVIIKTQLHKLITAVWLVAHNKTLSSSVVRESKPQIKLTNLKKQFPNNCPLEGTLGVFTSTRVHSQINLTNPTKQLQSNCPLKGTLGVFSSTRVQNSNQTNKPHKTTPKQLSP